MIKVELPLTYKKITDLNCTTTMFFDHAFLTLLIYRCNVKMIAKLIDMFLLGGE